MTIFFGYYLTQAGKTTLLHMLTGLLKPDAGKVMFGGADLYGMNDKDQSRFRNEHIGIITQNYLSIPSLSVSDLKDVYPGELSGGELRRMNLIRVLAGEAEPIAADEPTGDLDEENRECVMKKLWERADAGAAVLLVTHESDAAEYADQAYVMQEGCLSPASR